MSSITNSLFSNPGMGVDKVESKSRGTRINEIADTSRGSRPESKDQFDRTPGTNLDIRQGPPPANRPPNTIYIYRNQGDEKAREAFGKYQDRRKNATKQYAHAHANNSNYGLSSSSASAGSKSLALLSSASSGGKTQAVFSSKVSGGKSLV